MILLGVAAAAAIGSLVRALGTNYDAGFMRQMYGTAAVNIVGSFLLGLFASSDMSTNMLAVIGVGGLGALTTFSTFISQLECITREGSPQGAVLYGSGSLIVGIAAAYVGWTL